MYLEHKSFSLVYSIRFYDTVCCLWTWSKIKVKIIRAHANIFEYSFIINQVLSLYEN